MFALASGSPGSKDNVIKSAKKSQQRELILAGHYLKVVPSTLFEVPIINNLILLDLSNNFLQRIPDDIGQLINLEYLYVNGNALRELPCSLGRLVKLKCFDLSRNHVEVVISDINKLKELEWINLSGNRLREIPVYLLCLPKLKKVFCLRNPDLKNVPREVAREGLEAMRQYLNIEVEVCKPVLAMTSDDNLDIDSSDLMQEMRKRCHNKYSECKQNTSRLESPFSFYACKYCGGSGYGSDSIITGNVGTQTDYSSETSGSSCNKTMPCSDLKDYVSSKRELDSSDEHFSGCQGDVIERLSKLYREQLSLVNEEKTKILLFQTQRKFKFVRSSESFPTCLSCGLYKANISTSEYGSLTDASFSGSYDANDTNYISDHDSCCGITGSTSDYEELSDDDSEALDSEISLSMEDELSDLPTWINDIPANHYLNVNRDLVIVNKGAKLTIPEYTLSGHTHNDFSIHLIEGVALLPGTDSRSIVASPIVHASPHGAKFFKSRPATISIPLSVSLEPLDEVRCLVSDTSFGEPVKWHPVDKSMVTVVGDNVQVTTTHFSLFCAVAIKPYPRIEQKVTADSGGEVSNHDVLDGLSVYFPPKSLKRNVKASAEVLYYDNFYMPHTSRFGGKAIASPVIALGPSGMTFQNEVEVTIPIPKGARIIDRYGNQGFTILYSQSEVGEQPVWEVLHRPYKLHKRNDGLYCICFSVQHFTIFSILWNILDTALPDDMKLYASSYVPHFSFWVFFQALMTECHHNSQFGICVICCRSGNPVQGLPQYPIEIGECKPRKIKTGELEIKIKSGIFQADTNAGEAETGLMKAEYFTGREFDKQFACIFNERVPDYGLLGQVEIRRKEDDGSPRELFSFNLVKSAKRKVPRAGKEPSEWESKLFVELARMLSVDDHLWQEFALTLGYNRNEIHEKFGCAEDRMHEILVDYKTYRNGDPDDFSQALIKVARTFKLVPVDQMMENRQNRRVELAQGESSGQRDRPTRFCRCPPTPPKSPQGVKRRLEISDEPLTDARFDDIASEIAKSWKSVGRKLGLTDPELREIEMNYQNAGEKEKAFQMLTTWRERDPDNCTMEILYTALQDSGLRYTALRCLST